MPMTRAEARITKERTTLRLMTCAKRACSSLFAVCGACDRGRRFCSAECAADARRAAVRLAGRAYQASPRGRLLHAARQARYRERARAVTHQPVPAQHEVAGKAHPEPASVAANPRCSSAPAFACLGCGRIGRLWRTGFADRRGVRRRKATLGQRMAYVRDSVPRTRRRRPEPKTAPCSHFSAPESRGFW